MKLSFVELCLCSCRFPTSYDNFSEVKVLVAWQLSTGYSGTSLQRSAVPLAVFTVKHLFRVIAGAPSLLWLGGAATWSAASGTGGGAAGTLSAGVTVERSLISPPELSPSSRHSLPA